MSISAGRREGADAMPRCLEVDGLSGGYGRITVLHGISFGIDEAEIVGVLGHNGMGKSTLLKVLIGALPATGGTVRFFDSDITRLNTSDRVKAGIGYVPQGRGIVPGLSVRDNLRFGWQDHSSDDEASTLRSVLGTFPRIADLLERDGETLSGGEQQQLALARCLMGQPELLLLDEPTEGIQPSTIDELADVLSALRTEQNLSILLVEQNVDFIARLADRAVVLERGRIEGELAPRDLANHSRINQHLGLAAGCPTGTPSRPPANRSPAQGPSPEIAAFHPPQEDVMTIKRPVLSQMRSMADRFRMRLDDDELLAFRDVMEPYFKAYGRLDAMADNLPEVLYPRAPGHRPAQAENPLNAWYYRTDVRGAVHGPLRDRRIVLKDNVCLAGVPMMNGSSIMEGYTPEIDATVVTRILDAGGIIIGKAHCENFCLSGGSHTGAQGPVHNPWKHGYMAGGSSSGSAALVAAGEADMAIACDQGGSIRIPSSMCGVYGMKPTHGLVPYTGIMPIERTVDHVGPVTGNVADNALFLEVLAGPDGLDSRQGGVGGETYTEALGKGCTGLSIGILGEGFERPESEPDVDRKVRDAAERFGSLGANIREISIEEHHVAPDLWTAIVVEGLQDMMMHGNTFGTNCRGLFLPSMIDRVAAWRHRADELSDSLKVCMFLGEYFQEVYRGRFYGKAQNLMRRVTECYLAALEDVDLLLLPTVPMTAQPIPPADCPLELTVRRAFEMVGNTCPFNGGLPAMSVPCGLVDGLPVGMMLVAAPHREATIYRAAHAFEQHADWKLL